MATETERFCVDCKHFRGSTGYYRNCARWGYKNDLVTGERIEQVSPALLQRRDRDDVMTCGHEGRFFESKS